LVSELPQEAYNFFWGFDISKEEVIGEQIEEEVDAGLIVPESIDQIDEVLDRPFLVGILLIIEHLPREFIEEDDHLQFVEVHETCLLEVDDVDQQQHALLGGNLHQFVAFLADSQEGDGGEQRKGRKALVAEESDEELVLLAAGLHRNGLEQLHVVLDGFAALLVDVELLEEVLVHDGLGEDVDEVVGLAAVGNEEVEQFEDGDRGQVLGRGREQPLENVVFAQAAA
jgi:hypothetical protein